MPVRFIKKKAKNTTRPNSNKKNCTCGNRGDIETSNTYIHDCSLF